MKKRKEKDYIDFGQWLYELRKKKGLSEEQLVEQINLMNVQIIHVKKWERDLEFPELGVIYKLSEIYQVSSAEIIHRKQQTLQAGVEGIHMYFIRVLSLLMGISIYGTLWLCRIIIYGTLILVTIWFYSLTKQGRM